MSRKEITEKERATLQRLRSMALDEGFTTPPVREERYRIAEWIEQTIDEGWLPADFAGVPVDASDPDFELVQHPVSVALRHSPRSFPVDSTEEKK